LFNGPSFDPDNYWIFRSFRSFIEVVRQRLVKSGAQGEKAEPLHPMSNFSPGPAAGREGGWFACTRLRRQPAQANLNHPF